MPEIFDIKNNRFENSNIQKLKFNIFYNVFLEFLIRAFIFN